MNKGGLYLCMNTVDGIAHILRGRHNHGECEKDETGDTPVEPEHFAGRVKTRCHKIPPDGSQICCYYPALFMCKQTQ